MRNIGFLFEYNDKGTTKLKPHMERGRMVFAFTDSEFNGNTIKKLLGKVNAFEKQYKNKPIPIQFLFTYKGMEIKDKLSYVLFECICYYLIHYLRNPVEIIWYPKDTIWTQGVFSSPLLKLVAEEKVNGKNAQDFEKLFRLDIFKRHYRRLVAAGEKLSTNYLGDLYQEIDSTLKSFDMTDEDRDRIAQLCAELVGNAGEHALTDCLIDIDVTSDHGKIGKDGTEENGAYFGINIVVLNFSEHLIGDALKRMLCGNDSELSGRYLEVQKAFCKHSPKFNEKYVEDDFYNISVFQDKISGRGTDSLTGGKGLTLLIKTAQEKADSDQCYMLSGKRCLLFEKTLLEYDKDGWIGFNQEKNYFEFPPDSRLLCDCDIYLPGTAYNLNFVLKREV